MNKQNEPCNPRAAWPVIDGPKKGENIACAHDDFDVLIDPIEPRQALLASTRVRYYLRAIEGGGYVWSCSSIS